MKPVAIRLLNQQLAAPQFSNPVEVVSYMGAMQAQEYRMMRNCWMQDNTPVMVGMMAASPDGEGFKAKFEHFQIKHLPDQRRLEWLEKHK